MIPYEELVAALAGWRARQGLGPTSPAGARVSAPMAAARPPTSAPPAYQSAPPVVTSAPPAYAAAAATPLPDFATEDGTEIHEAGTGEIDIDSEADALDVIDEQPV